MSLTNKILIASGFTVLYSLMIIFYGVHGLDDAWTLSFDYYYLKDGYEFDRIFGSGSGVVAYFGKTHAFTYGLWSEIFTWDRFINRALSTILVITGILLWSLFAWKLTRSKNLTIAFAIICLLLGAFISTATKIQTMLYTPTPYLF